MATPSFKTRKSRSQLRVGFLSAIAKKYKTKILEPWEKLYCNKDRVLFLAEANFNFDGELRCPNCNKLLAKIKLGSILSLLDNNNPPVIEIKCSRTGCKELSRHLILKENVPNRRRRVKIRNGKQLQL